MTVTTAVREVFFTGTLITPDGSDSYGGEPCEPGSGATVQDGWVDLRWTRWEVYENREDVRSEVYEPEDGNPAQWLAEAVAERLGATEDSNSAPAWYAVDPDDNVQTGQSIRLAAHAKGFTDEEIAEADRLLREGSKPF